jgi:hypothetical protein
MNETTVNNSTVSLEAGLHLPMQAAPINRTLVGCAQSDASGVQPSFDLESFLAGVGTAAAVAVLLL